MKYGGGARRGWENVGFRVRRYFYIYLCIYCRWTAAGGMRGIREGPAGTSAGNRVPAGRRDAAKRTLETEHGRCTNTRGGAGGGGGRCRGIACGYLSAAAEEPKTPGTTINTREIYYVLRFIKIILCLVTPPGRARNGGGPPAAAVAVDFASAANRPRANPCTGRGR